MLIDELLERREARISDFPLGKRGIEGDFPKSERFCTIIQPRGSVALQRNYIYPVWVAPLEGRPRLRPSGYAGLQASSRPNVCAPAFSHA